MPITATPDEQAILDKLKAPTTTGGGITPSAREKAILDSLAPAKEQDTGVFIPAIKRGIGMQAQTYANTGALMGLGTKGLAEYGKQLVEANPPVTPPTLAGLVDKPWTAIKERTGEQLVNMATSLAGTAVGAAIGGPAGAAAGMSPKIAGAIGAYMGGTVATLPSTIGEVGMQQEQQGIKDPLRQIAGGVVNAAIEQGLGAQAVAGKVFSGLAEQGIKEAAKETVGKYAAARAAALAAGEPFVKSVAPTVMKSVAGFAGKALSIAAAEAVEEVPQNEISRWASHQDVLTKQSLQEDIDNAASAFAGSLLFGGVGGAQQQLSTNKAVNTELATLAKSDAFKALPEGTQKVIEGTNPQQAQEYVAWAADNSDTVGDKRAARYGVSGVVDKAATFDDVHEAIKILETGAPVTALKVAPQIKELDTQIEGVTTKIAEAAQKVTEQITAQKARADRMTARADAAPTDMKAKARAIQETLKLDRLQQKEQVAPEHLTKALQEVQAKRASLLEKMAPLNLEAPTAQTRALDAQRQKVLDKLHQVRGDMAYFQDRKYEATLEDHPEARDVLTRDLFEDADAREKAVQDAATSAQRATEFEQAQAQTEQQKQAQLDLVQAEAPPRTFTAFPPATVEPTTALGQQLDLAGLPVTPVEPVVTTPAAAPVAALGPETALGQAFKQLEAERAAPVATVAPTVTPEVTPPAPVDNIAKLTEAYQSAGKTAKEAAALVRTLTKSVDITDTQAISDMLVAKAESPATRTPFATLDRLHQAVTGKSLNEVAAITPEVTPAPAALAKAKKISPAKALSAKFNITSDMTDAEVIDEVNKEWALYKKLDGMTVQQVARHIATTTTNESYALIAHHVEARINALQKQGMKFSFEITTPDEANELSPGARGMSRFRVGSEGSSTSVVIKGIAQGSSGLNQMTILHELVHAATQTAIEFGLHAAKTTREYIATEDLRNVYNAVIDHVNARSRARQNLSPFEMRIMAGGNNALDDLHEIVAWTLTSPDMQEYMESIPYKKEGTLWSHFVQTIRNLLGLPAKADTALAEILRVTNELMKGDTAVLQSVAQEHGLSLMKESNHAQTETAQFKKWFGDSVVVDAEGKPLVVYHGTREDFEAFHADPNGGLIGTGHYFTSSPTDIHANMGGDGHNIVPVYLRIEHPIVSTKGYDIDLHWHRDGVTDGVIWTKERDGVTWYVVKDAKQIKSAIGNSGAFGLKTSVISNQIEGFNTSGYITADTELGKRVDSIVNAHPTLAKSVKEFLTVGVTGTTSSVLGKGQRILEKQIQSPLHIASKSKGFSMAWDRVRQIPANAGYILNKAFAPLEKSWVKGMDVTSARLLQFTTGIENTTFQDLRRAENMLHDWNVSGQTRQEFMNDPKTIAAYGDMVESQGWFDRVAEARQAIDYVLDAQFTQNAEDMRSLIADDKEFAEWFATAKATNENRKDTGYIPLRRYGDYSVAMYDTSQRETTGFPSGDLGLMGKWFFQTELEAREFIRDAKEQFKDEPGVKLDSDWTNDRPQYIPKAKSSQYSYSTVSFRQFLEMAKRSEIAISGTEQQRLAKVMINADSMYQNRIQQRKNIPGGTKDLVRSMSEFITHIANKVASDRMAPRISEAMNIVHPLAPEDVNQLALLQNEFEWAKGMSEIQTREAIHEQVSDVGGTEADEISQLARFNKMKELESNGFMAWRTSVDINNPDEVAEYYALLERSNALVGSEVARFDQLSTPDPQAGFYHDKIAQHVEFLNNPKSEAFANLRRFAAINFLGGSVAAMAVNLSSLPLNFMPYMHQYGGMSAYTSTMHWFTQSLSNPLLRSTILSNNTAELEQALTPEGKLPPGLSREQATALLRAFREEVVSDTQVFEYFAAAKHGVQIGTVLGQRAQALWMSPFRVSEMVNRVTSFMAAYDIGSNNLIDGKQLGAEELYQFARKSVDQTQFIYGPINRSGIAQTPVGFALMTFRAFPIMTLELLTRLPAKQRTIMLGTMLLASGVGGIPFKEDIADVLDMIGEKLFGVPLNTNRVLHNFFKTASEAITGTDLSRLIMTGPLDVLTGASIGSRVSMSNIIPASRIGVAGYSLADGMLDLSGVIGAELKGLAVGAGQLVQGNIGEAVTAAAPTALKGIMRYADGIKDNKIVDKNGNALADDLTMSELGLLGAGFTLSRSNWQSQKNYSVTQEQAFAKETTALYFKHLATAMQNGDSEGMRQTFEAVQQWNENNPEYAYKINPSTLRRELLSRNMPAGQRELMKIKKAWRGAAAEDLLNED